MAETKAARLERIHREALEEFDKIQSALRDERMQCLEDRRFCTIAGAQWEGDLGEQFANKPKFEFNKTHLAVMRVINEYRNNRITVDFTPKDGEGADGGDELADTCDGLYRADEQACTAEEAYDNAFDEGVQGGFGAWRLCAEYETDDDEDDDKQRIRILPVFDADSTVFFDLDAKRQDKADAKRAYLLTPYTYDAFLEEFGHDPSTWPKGISQTEFDWVTSDVVWVCEHYRVEERSELVRYYTGVALSEDEPNVRKVTQSEIDADPKLIDELLATGFRFERERRVKRREVRKYILSGMKCEEDCGRIAGKCIPIVPFYGKRWVVDGVERCMGHVRLAKDAQRLTNAVMSWLGEMAGRFDIEKPIFDAKQMIGHSTMWANDPIEKYPYMLVNALKDADGNDIPGSATPQAYTKSPNIPPVMAALMEIAAKALDDLLGAQQAGEQLQPNLSGKAVELIQTRLDMQVFIYMSNLAKSMKRSGEIWLSMMKDIAVEPKRRMKIVTPDGEPGTTTINAPAYDEKLGKKYIANDFAKANFDVNVDVGPSSTSLRASVVRALTGIASITEDPETKQALTLATISNIEGEGLRDLRDWARARAIRMGLIKPTEEETQQMAEEQANAKPDAQTQYLQSAAQEAEANAAQSRAKTVETIANAELKRAQTAKTMAETEGAGVSSAISLADAFSRAATPPAGTF
jgi:hypothetical protein